MLEEMRKMGSVVAEGKAKGRKWETTVARQGALEGRAQSSTRERRDRHGGSGSTSFVSSFSGSQSSGS